MGSEIGSTSPALTITRTCISPACIACTAKGQELVQIKVAASGLVVDKSINLRFLATLKLFHFGKVSICSHLEDSYTRCNQPVSVSRLQ